MQASNLCSSHTKPAKAPKHILKKNYNDQLSMLHFDVVEIFKHLKVDYNITVPLQTIFAHYA